MTGTGNAGTERGAVPARQPGEGPEVPEQQPAVVARGIRVSGPLGPVYGPIDLTIPAGGLNVLVCPTGSGRTALMMTLAGRMKPTSGELTVAGAGHFRAVGPRRCR